MACEPAKLSLVDAGTAGDAFLHVAARGKAADMTAKLFENGQADLATLLDARRRLNGAQSALAAADNTVFARRVALYKALGGGWSEADAVPETADAPKPQGA